jgi:hypothetical protein
MSSNIQFSTTALFISNFKASFPVGTIVETLGYSTVGDGGSGKWQKSSTTGQTPSQSPAQLGLPLLNDANGNQWGLVENGPVSALALGAGATAAIAASSTFGTAATDDVTTGFTDATVGRITKNGDWGIGSKAVTLASGQDLDTLYIGGNYSGYGSLHSQASTGDNPFDINGAFSLYVSGGGAGSNDNYITQTATRNTNGIIEIKSRTKVNTWSNWYYLYHAGNTTLINQALTLQVTTLNLIASTFSYASNTVINTTGFTTSGDGGEGRWKQNGVTGQTISQRPSQLSTGLLNDASGRQWALVVEGKVNAKSLGAVGDDTADDTLALRAWLLTGSSHYFPSGTYKTTGSITKSGADYLITGDGRHLSILKSYGNYSTLILDNSGLEIFRAELRSFAVIANTGNKTSGASIEATGSLRSSLFKDIYVRHYFDAFVFNGCTKFKMVNIAYDNGTRTVGTSGSYGFKCASTTEAMVDWHLINVQGSGFEAGGGHNINSHFYLRKVDGIYLMNSHFFYGDSIIQVAPIDSDSCVSIMCSNTYFDTIRLNHIRVDASTNSILRSWDFTGCTFRDAEAGPSINLSNTSLLDGLRITGGTIWGNFGSGIEQLAGGANLKGLVVTGVGFKDNNATNASVGGDIVVRSLGSTITGNSFQGGGVDGKCVYLLSTSNSNLATVNNMSQSTCTTQILDSGASNVTTGNLL